MAAIGLHHHTDVFKSKDIKGSELIHLNRDKLVVREIFFNIGKSMYAKCLLVNCMCEKVPNKHLIENF